MTVPVIEPVVPAHDFDVHEKDFFPDLNDPTAGRSPRPGKRRPRTPR